MSWIKLHLKPLMMAVATIAILMVLGGCSTIERIVDYGAVANTKAVESSVFTICSGASIGAIRRQFDTQDKVETWKKLCNSENSFEPRPDE